ncbi:hypothetical protein I6E74_05460 [Salinibacterium sp. SWN139]|uniref:hypothetical protein n=1 Tax=Salinibacterium sp. SWN139 TaxID=2792055 RepID=UPI0018CC92B2|nr:hypothetical protein [Salinibacterium sp. SWN139]MBH0053619.1 hypothetical protein [Salinibacterium sp. SWN139]
MTVDFWDKLLDIPLGLATTFIGIYLVYLSARPRVEFNNVIGASHRRHENRRYRIILRVNNRLLPVTYLQVRAALNVASPGRQTAVPIPLSRDTWFGVRRPKKSSLWNATPRLLLDEIDWCRHLPPRLSPPKYGKNLEVIMRDLNADLIVTVLATSAVFGVSKVYRHVYTFKDITETAKNSSRRRKPKLKIRG